MRISLIVLFQLLNLSIVLCADIEANVKNETKNGRNGSIELNLRGGFAPYEFSWAGTVTSPTSQNQYNLSAGSYRVTVTDSKCGKAELSITITCDNCADRNKENNKKGVLNPCLNADAIEIVGNIEKVGCDLTNNNIITTSVNGGMSPYTYIWSNGRTQRNINNVSAGTYTLTVTDSRGCNSIKTFIVPPSQPLTVNLLPEPQTRRPTCEKANNGRIYINVTGGTSPYTYSWSNGSKSQNLEPLFQGTYWVTVTDRNGCSASERIFLTPLPNKRLPGSGCTWNIFCADGTFLRTEQATVVNVTRQAGTCSFIQTCDNGYMTNINGDLRQTTDGQCSRINTCYLNGVYQGEWRELLPTRQEVDYMYSNTTQPDRTTKQTCCQRTVTRCQSTNQVISVTHWSPCPLQGGIYVSCSALKGDDIPLGSLRLAQNSQYEGDLDFQVKIYPNPVKDKVLISINAIEENFAKFQLFDLLGAVILDFNIPTTVGEKTSIVSLPEYLPNGIYIIRVSNEKGVHKTFKINKIN